ncbi:MAG: hypothetical protein AB7N80_02505 [Bdellovibrionales bacterium]
MQTRICKPGLTSITYKKSPAYLVGTIQHHKGKPVLITGLILENIVVAPEISEEEKRNAPFSAEENRAYLKMIELNQEITQIALDWQSVPARGETSQDEINNRIAAIMELYSQIRTKYPRAATKWHNQTDLHISPVPDSKPPNQDLEREGDKAAREYKPGHTAGLIEKKGFYAAQRPKPGDIAAATETPGAKAAREPKLAETLAPRYGANLDQNENIFFALTFDLSGKPHQLQYRQGQKPLQVAFFSDLNSNQKEIANRIISYRADFNLAVQCCLDESPRKCGLPNQPQKHAPPRSNEQTKPVAQ